VEFDDSCGNAGRYCGIYNFIIIIAVAGSWPAEDAFWGGLEGFQWSKAKLFDLFSPPAKKRAPQKGALFD